MPLDEMLDPRLPPDPLFDVQRKLVSITKVAFSYLNGNPESRLIIIIVRVSNICLHFPLLHKLIIRIMLMQALIRSKRMLVDRIVQLEKDVIHS